METLTAHRLTAHRPPPNVRNGSGEPVQVFFCFFLPECLGSQPTGSQALLADQHSRQPHLPICFLHIQSAGGHRGPGARQASHSRTTRATAAAASTAAAAATAASRCCDGCHHRRLQAHTAGPADLRCLSRACCCCRFVAAGSNGSSAGGGWQRWCRQLPTGGDPLLLCWLAEGALQPSQLLQQVRSICWRVLPPHTCLLPLTLSCLCCWQQHLLLLLRRQGANKGATNC